MIYTHFIHARVAQNDYVGRFNGNGVYFQVTNVYLRLGLQNKKYKINAHWKKYIIKSYWIILIIWFLALSFQVNIIKYSRLPYKNRWFLEYIRCVTCDIEAQSETLCTCPLAAVVSIQPSTFQAKLWCRCLDTQSGNKKNCILLTFILHRKLKCVTMWMVNIFGLWY